MNMFIIITKTINHQPMNKELIRWHPDEGPEDSTTMQEIDETLNAGQGGI